MKIVVALGGNAISREDQKGDIPDQINNCHITARYIEGSTHIKER